MGQLQGMIVVQGLPLNDANIIQVVFSLCYFVILGPEE